MTGARLRPHLLEEGGAKHKVKPLYNVIATGGGPGIMEAANRGAYDAGAPSIGYNITLPMEQEPNAYSTPDLTFRFHYFAMRKMHFAMRAAALVVFPGGFGTMDELFELLTLRQTGKMTKPLPVVLYDSKFWKRTINFQSFVDGGLISAHDLGLFSYADTPRRGLARIAALRPAHSKGLNGDAQAPFPWCRPHRHRIELHDRNGRPASSSTAACSRAPRPKPN
jgi:uncharacterized protein (TIGR00730 family)